MRLASQRQKMEDEQEKLDRLAEEELMAYEVARESLGEDAAYSLQMDNPLPAARMLHLGPNASVIGKTRDNFHLNPLITIFYLPFNRHDTVT